MRTAFVLSGGAALGAAQAGMLRGLYEHGVTPDLLVGTSVGALNAAFVASRPQAPATADALARVWLGLRRADAFPVSPRALVRGLRRRGDHVVPDRGLRRLLDRHLGVRRLEDAAVPLHVVAYDVGAGEERLLSDGPAADAVLASAAVPGLLPPVRRDGAVLVDGGVVNNTPVSHAVALGAQRVVVLSTQPSRVAAAPPRGPVAMALHAFTLLIGSRLEADAARYAGRVELLVIDAAGAGRVAPTDFTRARELVAAGLAASRSALADPHPKETIRHALDQPLLSVA
ncbi:MAG: patatin-like phospholipase family protein [Solirubrobacteraceae bacterium]